MEEIKKKSGAELNEKDIVYSKAIKAGKRIYYVDVKKNRKGELFIALTESKKVISGDTESPSINFEKHKIFLYKEDFEKFAEGLKDVIETIAQLQQGTKVNKERCIEEEVVSEVTYDKLAAITYEDL